MKPGDKEHHITSALDILGEVPYVTDIMIRPVALVIYSVKPLR